MRAKPQSAAVTGGDKFRHALQGVAAGLEEINLALQFVHLGFEQLALGERSAGKLGAGVLKFLLGVVDVLIGLLRYLSQVLILL